MNGCCHVLNQYSSDLIEKNCLRTPPKEAEVIQEGCGGVVMHDPTRYTGMI